MNVDTEEEKAILHLDLVFTFGSRKDASLIFFSLLAYTGYIAHISSQIIPSLKRT